MPFAIKAEVRDPLASRVTFLAQKTMYGGKHIVAGDTIFVFASGNVGSGGLVARGVVTSVETIARTAGVGRQTPLRNVSIAEIVPARRSLGRGELIHLTDWKDGQPATELNFKFYRQATNKIIGLTDEAGAFLDAFF